MVLWNDIGISIGGIAIEHFYKNLFNFAFLCQSLIAVAFAFFDFNLPFSSLALLPLIATAAVLSKEFFYDRDMSRRAIFLFLLHYGLYSLVVFILCRHLFDETRLALILEVFKSNLSHSPVRTLTIVTVSFAAADYLTWIVHYLFHKCVGGWMSIFLSAHLVHHSMDQMRLISVRHNGFSVLFATVPTCLVLTVLETVQGGSAAVLVTGLLLQIAFNSILTPFQHASFSSQLANVLRIPVGKFHQVHHDDSCGGSHYNYSVGVSSIWDTVMGTVWEKGAAPAASMRPLSPQFGKIGFRFSGEGHHALSAFFISQLKPLKVFRKTLSAKGSADARNET